MATATQRVLDTQELLEMILSQLPARDLLLAQRVDTTFRNATAKSIHIQRKLFKVPQPEREDGLAVLNPFILRVLRLRGIDDKKRRTVCVRNAEFNNTGLVFDLKGDGDDVTLSEARLIHLENCIKFTFDDFKKEKWFQLRDREAAYEKMLVADPPVPIMFWNGWNDDKVYELEDGNGIETMGEVLDAIEDYQPKELQYEMDKARAELEEAAAEEAGLDL